MLSRQTLVCSAMLLVAGCSSDFDPLVDPGASSSSQPIVGGVQDTGTANNAVVMIYSAYGSMCTGSLISPKVVLTAWHCVAQTNEYVTCKDSDVGADYKASNLYILKGPDPFSVGKASAQGQKLFHPAKSGKGLCGNDIALIALATPISGITPLPVRLENVYAKGEKFRAIGYGLTDPDDQNSSGVRYYRDDVQLTMLLSSEFIGTRSICSGDSGGPAISLKGAVIGVTSRGADCNGDDNWWTRVDKFRSLIDQAVGYAGGTYTDEEGVVHEGTAPDAGIADAQAGQDAKASPEAGDAATAKEAAAEAAPEPAEAGQQSEDDAGDQPASDEDAAAAQVDETQPRSSQESGCAVSTNRPSPSFAWFGLIPLAAIVRMRRRRSH